MKELSSEIIGNACKHKVSALICPWAAFVTVQTALRYGKYLDKGPGHVLLAGVGGMAAALSLYLAAKRVVSGKGAPFPWSKALRSGAYWRALFYLCFGIFLAGLFMGVARVAYMTQAALWLAICGHLAALSKTEYPERIAKTLPKLKTADMLLFNFFILVILAEIAVRTLAWLHPSPLLMRPGSAGTRLIQTQRFKPGYVHMGFKCNKMGYFDGEFKKEKPPNTRRIVALADSFGVGVVPYEKNYLTLLKKKLDNCGNPQTVEIFNMAIPGIGPEDYRVLLELEGLDYHPDEVLVSFFVGNDFRVSKSLFGSRSLKKIYPEDFALALTWRRLMAIAEQSSPQQPENLKNNLNGPPPPLPESLFMNIEKRRISIVNDAARPDFRKKLSWTFENLEMIRELSSGKTTMAIIPDEYQVNKELLEKLTAMTGPVADIAAPQKQLLKFCREKSIKCVDLMPALIDAQTKEGPVYALRDTHWNERGNRIAAEVMVKEMSGNCGNR